MLRLLPSLKRDQWLVLVSFFFWGLGASTWFHLQPLYIEWLGADPRQVGAAIGIPGFLVMFLYLPMSLAADRLGRRKPLIVWSWVLGTLATLLIGLAPDWRWVIPGLALFMISNFANPVVAAYIADTERGGNAARVFAILSAGWSIGNLAGPALGGWIAEAWGLRAVLLAAAGFSLLSTLATVVLHEEPAPPPEPKRRAPLRALLDDRPLLGQMAVLTLIVFALELGTVFSPVFLQDAAGLSVGEVGQLGTLAAAGLMITMLLLARMRPERRTPLALNQLVVALGLALLLAAPGLAGGAAFWPALGLGFFARGAAQAVWPVMRGRVLHWLPPQSLNVGFGFLDTALQAARTAAPFVAGQLYSRSPALPLVAGLGALGFTLLLTLLLPQGRPRPAAETPATEQL